MSSPSTNSADRASLTREGLHVMSKPIGAICNLDCEYCYYLHKDDLFPPGESRRMTDGTLERFIAQYIAAQPADVEEITFAWQGGEPTLLGLEFFQKAVALQQRYAAPGKRIANTLQTNGILLDEAWCDFLRENRFLVGLSLDGPAELHDRYRYDRGGNPSFAAALNGLKLLKAYDVEFNVLVVVNNHNGDHGRRVYTYLRDNGAHYMQFIPIVERRGIGAHAEQEEPLDTPASDPRRLVSSRSVGPQQFGKFLVDVFDEWIRRDVGKVFVQIFDQALSAWMGIEPSLCIFRKQCGRAVALEHNGDLFSCDHFVEPDYKLGNIHELPIVDLADSQRQLDFGRAKESELPDYCRNCEVLFACNGECPKNRFLSTPDGEAGLNYLCAGYRQFFNHIDSGMRMMAEELQAGRAAANVMHQSNAQRRGKKSRENAKRDSSNPVGPQAEPGRNDPCPCGSGRKYKKCCSQR